MLWAWQWLNVIKNALFGDELVNHYTYVIAGDGCLMEGISHEAASMAGHMKLGRMIVLFDDNGISIDGPTSITVSEDTTKRFEAYGWQVLECDGHDAEAVTQAITDAKADDRPSLIRCKTVIGYGAPTKKGTSGIHGAPLGAEEIAGTREQLGWSHEPFEIPSEIRASWHAVGSAGHDQATAWQARLDASGKADEFTAITSGAVEDAVNQAAATYKASLMGEGQKIATRVASQKSHRSQCLAALLI